MRVISGKARGKKLLSQQGLNTRPTLDRVKESLFNILQPRIENAKILDLFAGSGALGIEALSRGAEFAVFCDDNDSAYKIIKKNIEGARVTEQADVLNEDYAIVLKQLQNKKSEFDIIFLDPPYRTDFALNSLKIILEYKLLANEGIVIIETDDKNLKEKILNIDGIEIFDERKYGKVILIFIRKE